MTYVMSDIHGMCDKYVAMLDKIGGIKDGDRVYILGDIIDRGPDGDVILLSMMNDPRIIPIIGNHESLALPIMQAICNGKPFGEIEKTKAYRVWAAMGGEATAAGFLSHSRETQQRIIDYIESFRVYEEIVIAYKRFHLSHTLPEYEPNRGVHDVTLPEFIWGEPDYGVCYDPDVTFVTGHTPTTLINSASADSVWRGNGHIAIDCGAAFGGRLACICLETMEEYYV